MNKCNECMKKWINEFMNEEMSGSRDEMDEYMNVWLKDIFIL